MVSMQVSDDFQGGDSVLCMPRDLFEEPGSTQARPLEEEDTQIMAMQDLRLLLPVAPPLHHQAQVPPSSPAPLVPHESMCSDRGNTVSSLSLSVDGGVSLCSLPREWRFQVVASLLANRHSLASDLISAIDFDETGSRFATGGIARKIRVCSYTALVSDDHQVKTLQQEMEGDAVDEVDCFEEERQLWGSHGRGRSRRSSRAYCGLKLKNLETDVLIQNHDEAALRIICTPAKLSSLKWRPLCVNVIGCGDYDGVVTEWDVEQGLCISERYEHSGQRIWSVDYSSWFPTLCASASGDGTVRFWTLNCERSVGIIRSPGGNSICCAEFSSDGLHRVAVACADSNVYVYDVRRLDSSLLCLQGHERAASYVRFLGGDVLVSASIDSSVKLWDVSSSNAVCLRRGRQMPMADIVARGRSTSDLRGRLVKRAGNGQMHRARRTFNSHRNVRNFVGLSVWKESGLIACGSESNEVFVYDKTRNEPIWTMKFCSESFGTRLRIGEEDEEEVQRGQRAEESKCFVGAVCWQQQGDHHSLLTANSQGTLQLVKVM